MSSSIPANFGRAFDLSSLGKTKATSAATVHEATAENFLTDFVQISKTKPVLLVAYTDRAPQTLELKDLLAKLSKDDGESWKFGGVNIETEPQLVQALRIQSLPAAFAFIAEQVLPLPEIPAREDQIRILLAQVFKIASERGLLVNVPEIPEPRMEPEEIAALSAMEKGDYFGAAMAFKNWLQRSPNEQMAKLGLAQCELALRISSLDFERTLRDGDANPSLLQHQLMAADVEFASGRRKEGFERLLRAVSRFKGEDRNRAKDHLLLLFQLVDQSDPDLIKARQVLASALF
ncbi:MAG: tetratricopeptide repeat protein [Actinobacteria bacterium]|nr:tetratricopeptide repeat protein [Actinomycetota bacterium]